MKFGDRNTKYFHITASPRKRKNMISQIQEEGRILDEPDQIKGSFFKILHQASGNSRQHKHSDRLGHIVLRGPQKPK